MTKDTGPAGAGPVESPDLTERRRRFEDDLQRQVPDVPHRHGRADGRFAGRPRGRRPPGRRRDPRHRRPRARTHGSPVPRAGGPDPARDPGRNPRHRPRLGRDRGSGSRRTPRARGGDRLPGRFTPPPHELLDRARLRDGAHAPVPRDRPSTGRRQPNRAGRGRAPRVGARPGRARHSPRSTVARSPTRSRSSRCSGSTDCGVARRAAG